MWITLIEHLGKKIDILIHLEGTQKTSEMGNSIKRSWLEFYNGYLWDLFLDFEVFKERAIFSWKMIISNFYVNNDIRLMLRHFKIFNSEGMIIQCQNFKIFKKFLLFMIYFKKLNKLNISQISFLTIKMRNYRFSVEYCCALIHFEI